MKSLINRKLTIAALTLGCLMTVLLIVAPTRSGTLDANQYDPWADVSGTNPGVPDGKINMMDIAYEIYLFNAHGTPIDRSSLMSVAYDSGWVNIIDKCGQDIVITHNLNSTDLIVDMQGKTSLSSGPHQKHYGLTGEMKGWNRFYGGTDDDVAFALVQTVDGGYALAGYTLSFGAGSYDFWLVKTDASGTMQWNKTYGGTGYEVFSALVQTGDGGYALTGETGSFGAGGYDAWLVKTDAAGNMQWNQTYGGTNTDMADALVQTDDGGYALAGYTLSFGAGWVDAWLVKTDASGTMQWNKTYGGTDYEVFSALVQTGDGGYALTGETRSFGAGSGDFWLVKTDSAGTMQWNRSYGGTDSEVANALVRTGDGGYALAGGTGSFGAGDLDFWLVKTDASGTMQWNKTYGGTYDDFAFALVQTVDGGYALAGYTESFGAGNFDFWLVKTDASGTMQWNKTYGGTYDDFAFALVQTVDGGYALAGNTHSFGAGGGDGWLVRTDVESGLAWVDSSANTVTLYRGATDTYWNFVRVRLWQPKQTP